MKTLVVYYSETGTTRKAGRAIARALKADVEEIAAAPKGVWGLIKSAMNAARAESSTPDAGAHNPSDYDLVIVGTPTRNASLASPVRGYLAAHARHIGRVAFFCTRTGTGAPRLFREMESLAEQPPIAVLELRDSDMAPGKTDPKAEIFAYALQRVAPISVRPRAA
jgi:flavodoxin